MRSLILHGSSVVANSGCDREWNTISTILIVGGFENVPDKMAKSILLFKVLQNLKIVYKLVLIRTKEQKKPLV